MSLQTVRRKIDHLDVKMLKLLNGRAALAIQIGGLKKRQGLRLVDPKREQAVLRRLARANHGPLSPQAVRAIYREIVRQVRRLERAA